MRLPQCDFGSHSKSLSTRCTNSGEYHHTPDSYCMRVFEVPLDQVKSRFPDFRETEVTQEAVDHLGHWCEEHKLDGMVRVRVDYST